MSLYDVSYFERRLNSAVESLEATYIAREGLKTVKDDYNQFVYDEARALLMQTETDLEKQVAVELCGYLIAKSKENK